MKTSIEGGKDKLRQLGIDVEYLQMFVDGVDTLYADWLVGACTQDLKSDLVYLSEGAREAMDRVLSFLKKENNHE